MYEQVVQNVPTGVYEIDYINRKIINVNDVVTKYTGYSKKELLSMDPMNLLADSSKKIFAKRLKALSNNEQIPQEVEYEIKTKNGDTIWTLINVNLIKQNNKDKRAIVVAHDITERKKLEKKLNQTNILLKSLLHQAPIGYAFFDKDLRFKIINEQLASMNGVSVDDHIGKTIKEVLPTLNPACKDIIDKILATGKPVIDHEFKGETPLMPGVKRYWKESWYPVHDSSGTILGFGAIVQEITEQKKMEESLKESERKLKEAEQISRLGHVEYDVENSQVYWSKVVYDLYERNQDLGPPSYDEVINYHSPEDAKLLKKLVKRAIVKGKSYELDLKPDLPSGRKAYYHIIGRPIKNKKGKVSRITGTIQDITQRKKIEKSFIESEERFRLSQKAAGVISWEWDIKTGKINWLGEIKEIFGNITEKEISSYDKFIKHVHPDDQNILSIALNSSISNEKEFWVEHRILTDDESIRWVEEIGKIQFDKKENPNRILGITHDITREKNWEALQNQLNKDIQEERDLLKIIMENTDTHLAYLDPDFNFINVNTAYAYHSGFSKEELIGKNHFDLFPNEENEAIFKKVKKTRQRVEFEAKPFQFPGGNKTTYWNWSLNPILTEQKKVKGFVLSLIDVTDIKKKEEQIKKLNNALMKRTTDLAITNNELEAFTYSASHDLQAPLRSITGFSEILLEDYRAHLDDEGKDYLQRICRATNKMSQLINDLLKLSRISRTEMNKGEVNLSKLTEEVIDDFKQKDPNRDITINIESDINVEGDKNLLKIVLNNLIGNAWKFTKQESEPKISFGKTQKKGEPTYYVRDNGAGFDEKYAKKLFIPFQRLHDEKEYPGTGIGLPLVARIIHRHNGEIWAKSKEGKGATFYFTLTPLSK